MTKLTPEEKQALRTIIDNLGTTVADQDVLKDVEFSGLSKDSAKRVLTVYKTLCKDLQNWLNNELDEY